ncbi:hypothetical protein [Streptomyces parvus]|uniref:hypothetical protein n=1 Tax=Streptomyces parvus TaxID=66428 RepID=UPI0035D9FB63
MVRTKPSDAHLLLVRAITARGLKATTTQVERWQQHAWLPNPATWFEPAPPTLRPLILDRALWLAENTRVGRSIGWWGWVFWAVDGTPDSTQRLRAAIIAALERPLRRAGVGKIPGGNSDRAFQGRAAAAAKVLPNRRPPRRNRDEELREHAAEVGLSMPALAESDIPTVFHPALLEAGVPLLVGGGEDLGAEGLLDALTTAFPDHPEAVENVRQLLRQAELAGIDLLAVHPLAQGVRGMVRAIEAADDKDLCNALCACMMATVILQNLMPRAPEVPEIMSLLTGDPMWRSWAVSGGIVPDGALGLAAAALNTYQYLSMPDWAAELDRYSMFMFALHLASEDG